LKVGLSHIIILLAVILFACSKKEHPKEIKLTIYNRSSIPIDSVFIDVVFRQKYYSPIRSQHDTTFIIDLKNYKTISGRETSFGAILFQADYYHLAGFGFQWFGEMDTTTHYQYYVFDNGINKEDAPLQQPGGKIYMHKENGE
jgi:hypothetical protein